MPNSLQERMYYALPEALQEASFRLAMQARNRRSGLKQLEHHLRSLTASDWWTKEQIHEYQNNAVRNLIHYCARFSPYYARLFREIRLNPNDIQTTSDLQTIPVTPKSALQSAPVDFYSIHPHLPPRRTVLTSGTTGSPLAIAISDQAIALQRAVWARHRARFGLSPSSYHLMFGARVPVSPTKTKPPFWRTDTAGNRIYLSPAHINRQTIHHYANLMNEQPFEYYLGYPSAMIALATLLDECNLGINNPPKLIVTGSDSLTPSAAEFLTRTFGAPCTDQYGLAEFAGNASRCPSNNYHEDFEVCYMEHEDPAETPGRLLLTGWANPHMPLIRYACGDTSSPFIYHKCACGRSSKHFTALSGREEDYLRTPDGRRLFGMNQVLEYGRNVLKSRIYQHKDFSIEIQVVPGPGYDRESQCEMLQELERRGVRGPAIIREVLDIPLRPSGKFSAVVSEADQ